MLKNDAIRICHMMDAATEAVNFIKEKVRSDLDSNRMLELALIKCIETIGEATSNTSKECREEFHQIPWTEIIGMRNRLIHAYFETNLAILWETITYDIPPLINDLKNILQSQKIIL